MAYKHRNLVSLVNFLVVEAFFLVEPNSTACCDEVTTEDNPRLATCSGPKVGFGPGSRIETLMETGGLLLMSSPAVVLKA
jgi:hypothetical protein